MIAPDGQRRTTPGMTTRRADWHRLAGREPRTSPRTQAQISVITSARPSYTAAVGPAEEMSLLACIRCCLAATRIRRFRSLGTA